MQAACQYSLAVLPVLPDAVLLDTGYPLVARSHSAILHIYMFHIPSLRSQLAFQW